MSRGTRKHNQRSALDLGLLPVEKILATLGFELEPGPVIFSVGAQRHAENRHPDDFPRLLPFIGAVVANPLYLGDDGRNSGKIEFISRIPTLQAGMLVAVEIIKDEAGNYNVLSMYAIQQSKIQSRRNRGFLKVCK